MYCIQSSGDVYECVIDLNNKNSKYEEFKNLGTKTALKSNGELGTDDITNWITGSIGIYTMFNGRKIEK